MPPSPSARSKRHRRERIAPTRAPEGPAGRAEAIAPIVTHPPRRQSLAQRRAEPLAYGLDHQPVARVDLGVGERAIRSAIDDVQREARVARRHRSTHEAIEESDV